MKLPLTLLSVLIAVSGKTQDSPPATLSLTDPSGHSEEFRLVFNDEFDGEKLNSEKWKATEGIVRDAELVNSQNWFSRKNAEVSKGTLKLWIERDTLRDQPYEVWIRDGMKPFTNTFYFTSAEINSKTSFQYGYFEIRCRLPKGKGLVPAFWMYGEKEGVNNEIDVFEFWNEKGLLTGYQPKKQCRVHHMTVHYKGRMSGKAFRGDDHSGDFHTYALVWDECKIVWLVDDQIRRIQYRYKGMNRKKSDCAEFLSGKPDAAENVFPREAVEILAGIAVQSGERQPDILTTLPVAMEVDYIRYYERVGQ